MNPIVCALLFCSAFAADWVWIAYMREAAAKHAIRAALWSGALIALAGFSIVSYDSSPWYLCFTVPGAILGTWAAIKYGPK